MTVQAQESYPKAPLWSEKRSHSYDLSVKQAPPGYYTKDLDSKGKLAKQVERSPADS
jgi:hypothetical protein